MDLKMDVYSPNLELTGVLEAHKSVIWDEKSFSSGSFSVEALITNESLALLQPENIIWIEGETAGIIEYIEEKVSEYGTIVVKGFILTGILARRVLWGRYDLSGTVPEIMHHLVNDCCINPTRGDVGARKIPGLVLLDPPSGGESIRIQRTGANLLEVLEELGETYGVAFGVRFNPAVPQMEFWTRWGANRTIGQDTNPPVFYSTELDDVLSSEYSYNSQDYRNVALVAGEGEGNDRAYVTVIEEVDNAPAPPDPPAGAKYTITLSVDPAGSGVASGGKTVAEGTSITVTATPADGYEFVGWQENGATVSADAAYTFTVNSDRTLVAVFAAAIPTYTITATIDPAGSGTATGAGQYQEGETVTLKAEPADGYKFTGWQENGQTVSTDTEYSFTVTEDRTFVVAFAVIPPSRLPAGYTELEYIQSDSHSYIQTDIEANFSTRRIVMDIEPGNYVSASSTEGIMGAASSGSYYFTLVRSATARIMYRYSSNYGVFKDNAIENKRIIVDWDFPNDKLTVAGAVYATSKSTRTIGTKIKLFGSPSIVAKLYSAQIYTSSTLEADYIPCTNPSGAVGVYDLVGNKFYANADTGTFTAGPAV